MNRGRTRTPCRSAPPAAPVWASDTPIPDLNFRMPDLPPSTMEPVELDQQQLTTYATYPT